MMLAACFCAAFIFNQEALPNLPPLAIVLGRVGMGATIGTSCAA